MTMKTINFKTYKVSEFFSIEKTKSFNKEFLKPVVPGRETFDYVTRTSLNQGILSETGFINEENLNDAGTFSLGLLQMNFFYREQRWYAGQFVRKILPKIPLTREAGRYFETVFEKLRPIMLSVLVRDVDKTFSCLEIELPSRDNGMPDWDYMDRYIRELRKKNISRIQQYLVEKGYPDSNSVRLTESDYEVIQAHAHRSFKKYRVDSLFRIDTPKRKFNAKDVSLFEFGGHPYVVRTELNNGQRGFLKEKNTFLNPGNTLSLGQDTATIFYQKEAYFTGDKIKILTSKIPEFDSFLAMYFVTSMRRAFELFSWGQSFNVKILRDVEVELPINSQGEMDLQLMKKYTQILQKTVLHELRAWLDEQLKV